MQLYVLPLGACQVDKGRVITPGVDEGQWVDIPIWGLLIRTAGPNILVDTGMNALFIDQPAALGKYLVPKMRAEDHVVARLSTLGLTPGDIHFVVCTHLHFDHAGANTSFPDSTLLVQRDHFEFALRRPNAFPQRDYLSPALHYELMDGEYTLAPGVEVIRAPGHVPGLQALVLTLPESGVIVMASDAIYTREWLEKGLWHTTWSPTHARSSALRLQAIAEARGGQLWYGHDPAFWETLKKSPDLYR